MPRVSVIMAAYNGKNTIRESINSILSQTFDDFELIIVDDGSSDNTVDIVKQFDDKRIFLFQQKNSGSPAAPRNYGIQRARGEMIAFCDQDDLWYSNKLSKQIEYFDSTNEKGEIGIIFSSADLIDDYGKKVDRNLVGFKGYVPTIEAHKRMLEGDYIIACSVMIPKIILKEIGPLDEALLGVDDYDLWIRITEKYGVLGISERLCAWRQTTNSLSTDKTKQYIRTEQIFEKLGDKTYEERNGHGKNILRVVLSSLVGEDYAIAKEYLAKISVYPLTLKAKLIVKISNNSTWCARVLILFLQKIDRVRL